MREALKQRLFANFVTLILLLNGIQFQRDRI